MLVLSIRMGVSGQTSLSLCYEMDMIPRIERYNRSLDSILSTCLSDDYLFRLVAKPSFDPEYALQMELVEGTFVLAVLSFDQNIWYAKDANNIIVNEYKSRVEKQFAELMLSCVKQFINNRINLVCPPSCMDGDEYQFEIKENNTIICGQVNAPVINSPLGELCRLCNLLKDRCLMEEKTVSFVEEEFFRLKLKIDVDNLNNEK